MDAVVETSSKRVRRVSRDAGEESENEIVSKENNHSGMCTCIVHIEHTHEFKVCYATALFCTVYPVK